jgi:hypothetical protein
MLSLGVCYGCVLENTEILPCCTVDFEGAQLELCYHSCKNLVGSKNKILNEHIT